MHSSIYTPNMNYNNHICRITYLKLKKIYNIRHPVYTGQSTCHYQFGTAKMVEETMHENKIWKTKVWNNLGYKAILGRVGS